MGMSAAAIGRGVSSTRSCLAEGAGSRWALRRGAVGAGVTFPALVDSQPLPAPELLQPLPCWIAPENRDAPLEGGSACSLHNRDILRSLLQAGSPSPSSSKQRDMTVPKGPVPSHPWAAYQAGHQ